MENPQQVRLSIKENRLVLSASGGPASLIRDGKRLHGCSIADCMALKTDRARLSRLVLDQRIHVQPDLPKLVEDALAEYALAGVPFCRPSDIQRVAWLDETTKIRCRRSWKGAGFVAGRNYPISSRLLERQKIEQRKRYGHGMERVQTTGRELLFVVTNRHRNAKHGFTHNELSRAECTRYPGVSAFHPIPKLVRHFDLPDVSDVATAEPGTFYEMMRRMELLESS
ncbi:MAG: hypothetical protein LBK99_16625 [Opitutaceae bacterium]|nr:hypothetical protein [Opitutaceae bacterium]